jgi:predicted ATPase
MVKPVNNDEHLNWLVLKGYKSIQQCDLEMGALNLLIGANGAGKSNFIGFFKLIAKILDGQLQRSVGLAGGPDSLLHFGRKQTDEIRAELYFGENGYRFSLEPTNDNRLMFKEESLWWKPHGCWRPSGGHFESNVEAQKNKTRIYDFTVPVMQRWRVYHFHDTSDSAKVKQLHGINDDQYLREDAANLAAFLYRLKNQYDSHYQRIVKAIQLVAPFFGGFQLRPSTDNPDKIQLEWNEKGQDVPFKASELSDGTLRFICLATVLLQPESLMPSSILIDEPELGLHPYAIVVLSSLIKAAAGQHQLIISTQSVELVNEFEAEDLIVVDKEAGASTFKRPSMAELESWLEDYSLGELWKKNLLGGRPQR